MWVSTVIRSSIRLFHQTLVDVLVSYSEVSSTVNANMDMDKTLEILQAEMAKAGWVRVMWSSVAFHYNWYGREDNQFREIFDKFDEAKTGLISKEQFIKAVDYLNEGKVSDINLDEIFLKADQDKDGKLNFQGDILAKRISTDITYTSVRKPNLIFVLIFKNSRWLSLLWLWQHFHVNKTGDPECNCNDKKRQHKCNECI